MIQHLLILKRTGENIYKKSFGQIDMDETVMSGFFSAFFTFTQSLLGVDVQDIELGQYRMVFEVVEKSLILVAIIDITDSIINVQRKLNQLKSIIIADYHDCIEKSICNSEDFKGLSEIINQLIAKPHETSISEAKKGKSLQILNILRSSSEIIDCALITNDGVPFDSNSPREFLDLIIKQMDAFWKFAKNHILDQIVLYYENRVIILYKVDQELVLCALARRESPIGLVSYLVEEAADKIANLR